MCGLPKKQTGVQQAAARATWYARRLAQGAKSLPATCRGRCSNFTLQLGALEKNPRNVRDQGCTCVAYRFPYRPSETILREISQDGFDPGPRPVWNPTKWLEIWCVNQGFLPINTISLVDESAQKQFFENKKFSSLILQLALDPCCFFFSFQVIWPLAVGFFQEAKERREELQRLRHGSGEAKRSEIFGPGFLLLGEHCYNISIAKGIRYNITEQYHNYTLHWYHLLWYHSIS